MIERRLILGPMRVPFLILTPACVLVGIASAYWTSGDLNPLHVLLTLVGGLGAHVSVNALNEYHDFRSGLDFRTRRTPFSGGSGTLPQSPESARVALTTGLLALAITALVGVYFLRIHGLLLLPLGLAGLLIIVTYTPWLTHNPLLCLLAPGLGFGTAMVMGTDFALTGQYSWTAFIASMVPFFLVSNLLLLNQFPDVEADRSVGRRHFPLLLGRTRSAHLYGVFLLGAFLTPPVGAALGLLPWTSLLGLLTIALALPTYLGARRRADEVGELIPYLGMNVMITVVTPVLVAVGLFIA